jgi:membrane associated rhomboid family serine protease
VAAPQKPRGTDDWTGEGAYGPPVPRGRVCNRIAAVTALSFVLAWVLGYGEALSYGAGFIPARIGQPGLLDHAGLGIPAVPLFLTPLSATLLHGSWMHLGFNMVIFLFCGRQVEMVLGGRLLLVLYAIGAYAAAAGQWALSPNLPVPMIGASGSVSAIIGAYALLYSNREVRSFGPISANVVRMLWLGAGWIFIQFLIGIASNGGGGLTGSNDAIAVGAHIGGFIVGMLLIRPLLKIRFRNAGGEFPDKL